MHRHMSANNVQVVISSVVFLPDLLEFGVLDSPGQDIAQRFDQGAKVQDELQRLHRQGNDSRVVVQARHDDEHFFQTVQIAIDEKATNVIVGDDVAAESHSQLLQVLCIFQHIAEDVVRHKG